MSSRPANLVGVASVLVLVTLISLEFWAPFYHVWDVQFVGFVLNSGASLYAGRRGNRGWYVLLGLNVLLILLWIVALGG